MAFVRTFKYWKDENTLTLLSTPRNGKTVTAVEFTSLQTKERKKQLAKLHTPMKEWEASCVSDFKNPHHL